MRTADDGAYQRGLGASGPHAGFERVFVARLILLDERNSDEPHARFYGYLEFQRGVSLATGHDWTDAAYRNRAQPLAVDGDLELVSLAGCACHLELDLVVAVHREGAADRDSAARAERQFVDPRILPMFRRKPVDIDHRWHRGIAHREA